MNEHFCIRNKNTPYNREEENKMVFRRFNYSLLYFFFFWRSSLMRKESDFQSYLITEIKGMLPGCIVMKNDPTYIQGIPDLIVLYEDKWAALECKRSANAGRRPNQEYYISKMGEMSYASFIYPENKEEVLNELQQALQPRRKTRSSKR